MNRYYKVVDSEGKLIQIGKDKYTGEEISEKEYMELYEEIQKSIEENELDEGVN